MSGQRRGVSSCFDPIAGRKDTRSQVRGELSWTLLIVFSLICTIQHPARTPARSGTFARAAGLPAVYVPGIIIEQADIAMQLVFYMTPEDERGFVGYIFSRAGYLTPRDWKAFPPPIIDGELSPANGRSDNFRELMIYKDELHPRQNAVSEEWKQFWTAGGRFVMAGPGIEWTRSCGEEGRFYPGRLWFGAVRQSFFPPGQMNYAEIAKFDAPFKELQNFYRACCANIRRSLRKYSTGWYIGHDVDSFCETHNLSRAPSTHC